MIGLIDYGMGNLTSVRHALHYLGAESEIIQGAADPDRYHAVILPGVGAFDEAVKCLREKGLADFIVKAVSDGKPFLGICLGLQLLFEKSEEGKEKGLGLLKGTVRRLPPAPGILIPHMGWNILRDVRDEAGLLREGDFMYFVHSYYADPEDKDVIAAFSEHGIRFTASVRKDNLFACQFHPERSGTQGLALLRRWLDTTKEY